MSCACALPEVGIDDRNAIYGPRSTISNVFLQFEVSRVIRPRLTAGEEFTYPCGRVKTPTTISLSLSCARAVAVKNGISSRARPRKARRDPLMAGN